MYIRDVHIYECYLVAFYQSFKLNRLRQPSPAFMACTLGLKWTAHNGRSGRKTSIFQSSITVSNQQMGRRGGGGGRREGK